MVRLYLKSSHGKSQICLGLKKIKLLFNVGPFPSGGDCLIVEVDGEVKTINSNDLIGDMEAYTIVAD